MGMLGGLFKIAGSVIKGGPAGGHHDGPQMICHKCGMPYHGVCRSCAQKESSQLLLEGISEIKQAYKDPIIEAEKRGCERATQIYRETFEQLKRDHEKWEHSVSMLKKDVSEIKRYASKLKDEKSRLENEYASLLSVVATKHQLSESTLANAIGGSSFMRDPLETGTIFDLFYRSRERKTREAEQRGFEEGKRIFEEKIKKELEKIEAKSKEYEYLSNRTESLRNNAPLAFDQIAKEISNLRIKIAALKHGE